MLGWGGEGGGGAERRRGVGWRVGRQESFGADIHGIDCLAVCR